MGTLSTANVLSNSVILMLLCTLSHQVVNSTINLAGTFKFMHTLNLKNAYLCYVDLWPFFALSVVMPECSPGEMQS